MPETYHLRCWTRFFASLDEVWSLKTDPAELRKEMAPLLALKASDANAEQQLHAALQEGDADLPVTLEANIGLLGALPGPAWPVEIVAFEKHKRFVDRSENALFARWEHEHVFEEASDAVRYLDAVTFQPRSSADKLIARGVLEFFLHRHRRAAKRLDTDVRATAVAVMRCEDPSPQGA